MRKREEKRKRGKDGTRQHSGRTKQRGMAAFLLLLFQIRMFAGIVPDPVSLGTSAVKTAGGLDQVDIARPNDKGTSYNAYKEFDVAEKGLILNNNIQLIVDTKLAGFIARNRNLDGGVEAKLIINDVTGNRGSTIRGYIEIGGKKADVVIANRNGISVSGGGFINTGNATLTTGTLVLNAGELDEINVDDGHVAIGVGGIDAASLETLDISGKTISIEGAIKGSDKTKIQASAGSQNIRYRTKKVTGGGKSYEGIAIDGKALGSMYAGKIDVISNDKGAGVNLKGDLISLDDLTLTAGGQLTTAGKVQSPKTVRYKSDKGVRAEKAVQAGKKLELSGEKVELAASVATGYLKENGEQPVALEILGDKAVNSGEIEVFGDTAVAVESFENSGSLTGGGNIALNAVSTANTGAILGKQIDVTGKAFSNTGGIVAAENQLNARVAAVANKDGILTGKDLSLLDGRSVSNTGGILYGGDSLKVLSDTLRNNADGRIYSDGNMTLATNSLDNSGGLLTGQLSVLGGAEIVNDDGTILSSEALQLSAYQTSNVGGLIYTDQSLSMKGSALDNTAGTLVAQGDLSMAVRDVRGKAGAIYAGNVDIQGDRFSNADGTIDARSLTAELTEKMDNTGGTVYGEESVRISAPTIVNRAGTIATRDELSLRYEKLLDNGGGTLAGQLEKLSGEQLINAEGQIFTGKALDISNRLVDNSRGEIYSPDKITVSGESVDNDGGYLHTDRGLRLAVERVSNREGYLLSDGLTKEMLAGYEEEEQDSSTPEAETSVEATAKYEGINIAAVALDNTKGTIRSLGDLNITADTINSGGLLAGENLNLAGLLQNEAGELFAREISVLGNLKGNADGEISAEKLTISGDTNNNLGVLNAYAVKLDGRVENEEGEILAEDLAIAGDTNNTRGILSANVVKIGGRADN
ncbi:MAG: filamentous hemagglutinin N-terminal domain-containing protein, partial [Fusobacteriaceae bacterium]|nr:filamentous hemagglutinin N-terminal domain-containing protein [Fusobacteriaceae bacterium]